MRIQHNIMAMNAYRNYTNNTSAVAKNLEKLSSGYRINRAGDDAAGLAISEKMRAQITGLSAAQKNVKDGISLVKTAEGATQEIHDMLNRMVYLAEQSANGTYQDDVDRDAIQNEFNALKKEIDRIADSSNFNGIKLLDGSLDGGGSGTTSKVAATLKLSNAALEEQASLMTDATASVSEIEFTDATAALAEGESIIVKFADDSGKQYEAKLTLNADGDKFVTEDGIELGEATKDTIKATEVADAVKKLIDTSDDFKSIRDTFTVESGSGKLTFTSKEKGSNAATIETSGIDLTGTAAPCDLKASVPTVTKGSDAFQSLDVSAYLTAAGATGWDKTGTVDAADAIIDINGLKFAIAADEASAQALTEQFGSDLNVIRYDTDAGTTATQLSNVIHDKLGLDTSVTDTDTIDLKAGTKTTAGGNGGLTLQIGDTSDDFNQLTVSIKDMHASALGISNLDLNTQAGAQAAVAKIKDAINKVSSTRGELGATQNRLEHTQNNLSVMKENIQDAESSIRDTDIAEEMMAYTKNNILVQSAQAMLAQANQVPQGVLQLLG